MWTLLLSVLLWATVIAWYMPSCPVHVSLLLPVLLHFLNEINGDGDRDDRRIIHIFIFYSTLLADVTVCDGRRQGRRRKMLMVVMRWWLVMHAELVFTLIESDIASSLRLRSLWKLILPVSAPSVPSFPRPLTWQVIKVSAWSVDGMLVCTFQALSRYETTIVCDA